MNVSRPSPRRLARQRGFSLIVSLMMLIVIIILGVGASQMAVNEERGSRADRDRQIAFQAAEAALKDAEIEILGPPGPAIPPGSPGGPNCQNPAELNQSYGRAGTFTCFNATNQNGFVTSANSPCSPPPNAGLCPYDGADPAWRRPTTEPHVDFVADAKNASGATLTTVGYGQYTGRVYRAQYDINAAAQSGATTSLSIYPPRYIIERVFRNTSVDTQTGAGIGSDASGQAYMYRITAMGFGPTVNSQVVLQTVIATKD